jgi:hypothetical protein
MIQLAEVDETAKTYSNEVRETALYFRVKQIRGERV